MPHLLTLVQKKLSPLQVMAQHHQQQLSCLSFVLFSSSSLLCRKNTIHLEEMEKREEMRKYIINKTGVRTSFSRGKSCKLVKLTRLIGQDDPFQFHLISLLGSHFTDCRVWENVAVFDDGP